MYGEAVPEPEQMAQTGVTIIGGEIRGNGIWMLQQRIDRPAAGSPDYLVKKISEPIEDVFKKRFRRFENDIVIGMLRVLLCSDHRT